MSLEPGDRIGDWVVEGHLGRGAMANVYRCRHALSGKMSAAVKLFQPDTDQLTEKWFSREVEALAALRHPGIVRILHPGEDLVRGLQFLAMELVDGQTLRERMRRGPLPAPEARDLFAGIAEALAAAHAAQIFHRDIKPSNVMVRGDGTPVVLDFGIATHSDPSLRTTTAVGTPSYMAPELFDEAEVDPARTDVYGVGVMLHEAITGKRPFEKGRELNGEQRLAAVLAQKLTLLELDPGPIPDAHLREIIRRSTARDPLLRPASMVQLCSQLRYGPAVEEGPSSSIVQPIPEAAMPPSGSKTELLLWVLGAGLLAILGAAVAGTAAWFWVMSD